MSQPIHTVEVPEGAVSGLSQKGRLLAALAAGVANAAGGGAGQAVTVVVTGLKNLPANYAVLVNPGQDCTWWVDTKSGTGFTIHLLPRLAANTIASGTVDWALFG